LVDFIVIIEFLSSIIITATIGLFLYQYISKFSRHRKDISTIDIEIERDLTTRMIEEYENRISNIDDVKEKSIFIMMIIEIEKELRQLTARLIDTLIKEKYLDPKWSAYFRELWYIRNKVIHGEEVSRNNLEFGINMAIMFLRSLREFDR